MPANLFTVAFTYADTIPVSDGAAPSLVSATVPEVVIFGCEIVIPDAGIARVPIASIAGRDPISVSITVGEKIVGENAGLVEKSSSAAVSIFAAFASACNTHSLES